jgi:hypothetical protein
MANAFDIPGMRNLVDNIINDTISKILVLPNRLVIPIIPDFNELDSFKSLNLKVCLRELWLFFITNWINNVFKKGVVRIEVLRAI